MKFYGDYHTHSVFSDGRGTVAEMVAAAARRGLKEIGITDHGPANIGTGVKNEDVFLQIRREIEELQPALPELKIFLGAEADPVSPDGELDISRKMIDQLDYLLVGLHPYVRPKNITSAGWLAGNQAGKVFPGLRSRIINANTKALVEAVHKYKVKAITHPGLMMPIDIGETARACLKCGVAWEINSGHRFPSYREVLRAARCGVDFIVSSDAHFPETVGRLDYGAEVLHRAGVPAMRVVNAVDE
ncbi:MAG: PHP domain-containing protein [Clostridia bacterium]|nr:PHP domain-containing protein [Clostridia bacterium]